MRWWPQESLGGRLKRKAISYAQTSRLIPAARFVGGCVCSGPGPDGRRRHSLGRHQRSSAHPLQRADCPGALAGRLAPYQPRDQCSRGPGLKQVTSQNWSGYADDNSTGKVYSEVSGKWKEPAIKGCTKSSPLTAVVFWVGLDGLTDGTVEQDGTAALCSSGSPIKYYTWWEMYPSNNVQLVGSKVKPGDTISASVIRSGTSYKLSVTDSTTPGNSFSTTHKCAATTCKDQSAEWIAEAPSTSSGEVPLPNFGIWTLINATVKAGSTSGTIKTFPDNQITMKDTSPKNSAAPGPLNTKGNNFKDVWKA